jgi:transcriptional regulator with GAF, ATPase, and Fis domain
MERTVVLCQGDSISEADLAGVIRVAPGSDETPPPATPFSLPLAAAKHEFERSYLVRLMLQADGSLAAAARSAGLDRSNLRRLLRRFRINTAGA